MTFPFQRVALVGFGLMGGSLARALKALENPPRVSVLSKDSMELEAGMAQGLIGEGSTDDLSLLEEQDLIVYATPPEVTLALLKAHAPHLMGEQTLTDVVSLNAPFLQKALELGLESRAVSSHPMAGGTGSGFSFSQEGLFKGARVWVSQGGAEPRRVQEVEAFWANLGGDPGRLEARVHDEMMAWVSHLPQLISNALAKVLADADIGRELLGPGGKDVTRLAGSDPGMWRDLLREAPGILPEAVAAMKNVLGQMEESLREGKVDDLAELMEETRKWSERTK
jgi:prephenate dehydrogenase